jgi:hypothetical protein
MPFADLDPACRARSFRCHRAPMRLPRPELESRAWRGRLRWRPARRASCLRARADSRSARSRTSRRNPRARAAAPRLRALPAGRRSVKQHGVQAEPCGPGWGSLCAAGRSAGCRIAMSLAGFGSGRPHPHSRPLLQQPKHGSHVLKTRDERRRSRIRPSGFRRRSG